MLRQNNEQTSGILSSRLSGKKGKSDVVDISALRHNKADDNTVIPTYGPSQPEVAESSSQKPKKQKMEKPQRTMKKRRPRRRKDASSGNTQSEPLESANDLDELIDAESFRAARRQEHIKMVKGRSTRTAMILIILLCLYIAFLIFGLMQTSYIYNEDGKVVPEILSVEDLRTLNQYDMLSYYYLRVCILYEHNFGAFGTGIVAPASSIMWLAGALVAWKIPSQRRGTLKETYIAVSGYLAGLFLLKILIGLAAKTSSEQLMASFDQVMPVSTSSTISGFLQSMLWILAFLTPITFLGMIGKKFVTFRRSLSKDKVLQQVRGIRER